MLNSVEYAAGVERGHQDAAFPGLSIQRQVVLHGRPETQDKYGLIRTQTSTDLYVHVVLIHHVRSELVLEAFVREDVTP